MTRKAGRRALDSASRPCNRAASAFAQSRRTGPATYRPAPPVTPGRHVSLRRVVAAPPRRKSSQQGSITSAASPGSSISVTAFEGSTRCSGHLDSWRVQWPRNARRYGPTLPFRISCATSPPAAKPRASATYAAAMERLESTVSQPGVSRFGTTR